MRTADFRGKRGKAAAHDHGASTIPESTCQDEGARPLDVHTADTDQVAREVEIDLFYILVYDDDFMVRGSQCR